MSNRLRFRSGQVELRKFAVDSGTVIEAGDMVYLDTDDVKPASDLSWDTNLAGTQADFAEVFAGIAHEPSADGETDPISVDVSPNSVYEFQVASASYITGAPLGPDEVGSEALGDQTLEAAAEAASIARAAETKATTTKLLVTFASSLHTASANVNAGLG